MRGGGQVDTDRQVGVGTGRHKDRHEEAGRHRDRWEWGQVDTKTDRERQLDTETDRERQADPDRQVGEAGSHRQVGGGR